MGTGAKRIYFYFTCRWINFDIKKKKTGKALLVLGVIFIIFFYNADSGFNFSSFGK